MKYLFFLTVLLVNASLFSYGQDIKFSKRKYGLLNQSRVGRSGVQFEKPRVGRSDMSSKFDPNSAQRYDESFEVDTENDINNGRVLKLEGNYREVLIPFYLLPNGKLWTHSIYEDQS